jgi:uncharacterized repeat protein (TIGR03803 family)
VIHSFAGPPYDGAAPAAALLKVRGTLYGTTVVGGTNSAGTVFAIPSFRPETTLYSFAGSPYDGSRPAGLINVNGTLYGTTEGGGANCGSSGGCGTVFSITPSGTETVLHSFAGAPYEGARPTGLIKIKGTLYGTTLSGGTNNDGTVFSLTPTPSGTVTTLYSFAGAPYDGANPKAGLVNLKGTLYGTTFSGGAKCSSSSGCGTVFAITPSGAETVLYSFGGGSDGARPVASLINVNGTLYGTTYLGGTHCNTTGGCGTVYAVTPLGVETVLHSFAGGSDGANPAAGLLNVKGTLYGTTSSNGGSSKGGGTVFSIPPFGSEIVLHNFAGGPYDGNGPEAALINVNGTLYGTTESGGANNRGTVFSLTP